MLLAMFAMIATCGNALAEDVKAVAAPPDIAQHLGDAPLTFEDLAKRYENCKQEGAKCESTLKIYNQAWEGLAKECKGDCTPEQYLKDKCAKVFANAKPKSPASKKLASGNGKVRFVPCLPPAEAKNGVCWCPDPRVKTGDAVTAKTFGAQEGACVPTLQGMDKAIESLRKTQRAVCKADGELTPEKLAEFGIESQLDTDDELCVKTGKFIVYLVNWHSSMKRQNLTPENWALVWADYQNRTRNGEQTPISKLDGGANDLAQIKEQLQDHEDRLLLLEGKGVHVQFIASPFYHWRPAKGAQDTYGITLKPNIIVMMNKNDGVMFGSAIGYAHQTHSDGVAWRMGAGWYHLFDRKSGANASYAFHLGGCFGGNWLVNNVQDDSYGGICTGGQIVGKRGVLDLTILGAYGRRGMYQGGQRIGYSPMEAMIGIELGGGLNLF